MTKKYLPSRSRHVNIDRSSFNFRALFQLLKVLVHVKARTMLSAATKAPRAT